MRPQLVTPRVLCAKHSLGVWFKNSNSVRKAFASSRSSVSISDPSSQRGSATTFIGKAIAKSYVFRSAGLSLGDGKHSMAGKDKDQVFTANLGPLSPRDEQVQKRLLSPGCNPPKVLRQCIASGTASLHVVQMCLQAQHMEVTQVPRVQQLKVARSQDPIASTVLAHLFTDDQLWGPFALYATKAQFHLMYYAILEGFEDGFFFDWLATEVPHVNAWSNLWRGTILRNLVAAHHACSSTRDKGKAIQCLLGAYSKRLAEQELYEKQLAQGKRLRKPGIINLDLFPAYTQLVTVLTFGYCSNTKPELFEKMIELVEAKKISSKVNQAETDYNIAFLSLYHPGYPQDTFAVDMLHRFADGDVNAFPASITTPKGEVAFKRFLQRTTDVLLANGNSAERDWVKHKFNVLVDTSTGNFAEPTLVGRPKMTTGRSSNSRPVEGIPFPTFM